VIDWGQLNPGRGKMLVLREFVIRIKSCDGEVGRI
jgi:hypothetical protein